jgi:hypothetical protein
VLCQLNVVQNKPSKMPQKSLDEKPLLFSIQTSLQSTKSHKINTWVKWVILLVGLGMLKRTSVSNRLEKEAVSNASRVSLPCSSFRRQDCVSRAFHTPG